MANIIVVLLPHFFFFFLAWVNKIMYVLYFGCIPGLGGTPGGWHGNSLQYSGLENPMDRGAWRAAVHGVSRSQTGLKHLGNTCVVFWKAVLDLEQRCWHYCNYRNYNLVVIIMFLFMSLVLVFLFVFSIFINLSLTIHTLSLKLQVDKFFCNKLESKYSDLWKW